MKNNNLFLFGLMAAFAVIDTGCSTNTLTSGTSNVSIVQTSLSEEESTDSMDTSESSGSSESTDSGSDAAESISPSSSITAQEAAQNAYSSIISGIIAGYKNEWKSVSPEDLDISEVHSYSSDEMGFITTDINDDGIDELIVGENLDKNGTKIYDMYSTNSAGEVSHVICGGERDVFYLTDDNTIQEVGQTSAKKSFTKEYVLEDCTLEKISVGDSEKYQTLKLNLIAEYLGA